MARSIFYDSLKKILFAFVAMMFVAPVFSATLPAGYTELEYIESDGNAWIDTGLLPSDDLGYKFNIILKNTEMDAARLGVRQDASTDSRYWWGTNVNTSYIGWDSVRPAMNSRPQALDDVWYEVAVNYMNDRKYIVDNNVYISNIPTLTTTYTHTFPIFTARIGDDVYHGVSKQYKLRYITFTRGNSIIQNLVPAKNSSGVIGMYDTANGGFYTNRGTGTFTAGPATCRNLFDENSNLNTHIPCAVVGNYPSINATTPRPNARTYFMTVKPNTTYTISMSSVGDRLYVFGINDIINPYDYTSDNRVTFNRTILSYQSTIPTTVTFTTNSTEKMVAVYYALENIPTHFQIEEGSTATAYAPYCAVGDGIKIATTKYNEDAFANLVTTLNSAITKVTNIVDTTVAQATSIGTLATTKQDRPADGDCPAGRKCLLVTGTDGKPHWYLIQE